MTTLVINSGSSSVKTALFATPSFDRLLDLRVNGIGEAQGELHIGENVETVKVPNHTDALQLILQTLIASGQSIDAIAATGHRVLHGGETLVEATLINDDVERVIDSMSALAPLHNPACLAGIKAARAVLQHCPHVAVFDTAFHATLLTPAKMYALSDEVTATYGLRRFGFHGISHEYVTHAAANALATRLQDLRIISCHLGNGCSVTAVENGRSVETSMGMTPLEGLVMGTRSGDVDPGIVIQLFRDHAKSPDALDVLLNRHSGLLGMTGTNDMRKIEQRAADGDEACRRAIDIFIHRARKYVGAYAAVMGGVDAIVFTGGIGENSVLIRHGIAQRLDFLGATLDDDRNRNAIVSEAQRVVDVSSPASRVKLLVIATDEEVAIAHNIETVLGKRRATNSVP